MDTPSEITSLKRNRPKKLLAPNPFGIKKLFHRSSNFDDVCLSRKVPRSQKLDLCVRQVFLECFRTCGDKKGIVFTPDRKQRRLPFAEILLKFRVELHVGRVVQK